MKLRKLMIVGLLVILVFSFAFSAAAAGNTYNIYQPIPNCPVAAYQTPVGTSLVPTIGSFCRIDPSQWLRLLRLKIVG